ncbi:MAG: alkaline phosphatase family protein [Deltaproteobacteria bacterium]
MRIISSVLVAAALLSATIYLAGPQAPGKAAGRRVMVLGIDGGTWKVMEPMFERGELPVLHGLYKRGIHGVLRSRPPVLSPVVWTTIFTGHDKERHGVVNWKTSQSTHRRVRSLWQISSQAGLVTDVFNVPSTWPPEPVSGVMLSGFPLSGSHVGGNTGHVYESRQMQGRSLPPVYRDNRTVLTSAMGELALGAWSPWVAARLGSHPSYRGMVRIKRLGTDAFYLSPFYRVDPGLVVSHPGDVTERIAVGLAGPYIPEGPGWSRWAEPDTPKYLYEHLVDVSRIQTDAVGMFVGGRWDLLIYVNTLVDRVSHPYWAYMRPEDYEDLPPEKAALYSEAVRDSYRETDRQLGRLLDQVQGEFYVVLASDHGFKSNRNRNHQIGTHDFDGIYLVAGPGLGKAAGSRGGEVFIESIAPTVLHLLGLPVAKDMTGKVMPDLAAALGRPVAEIDSYESGGQDVGSTLPVDAATWEQLRGLGYVE